MTHSWAQEKVSKEDIRVTKVKKEENLSGALTKPVSKVIMTVHPRGMGGEIGQDRRSIAPVSGYEMVTGEEWKVDEDGMFDDVDLVHFYVSQGNVSPRGVRRAPATISNLTSQRTLLLASTLDCPLLSV